MKPADVYFTDLRTAFNQGLLIKLRRLIDTAGFGTIDFADQYAAIKIHFGEPGNLAFLRPNFAATVAEAVREHGGKPFLTDCNTLYVGGRKNALDHIESAYRNGYTPYTTGCHILIGDGLKGTDEVELPVPNGEYLKTAKIGRAIADADIIISLNHFKGHECTGFGGAIKNLGMGSGSRAGKKEMHCDGITEVDPAKCVGCGRCVGICAHGAPKVTDRKAAIDPKKCVGCGRCIAICPKDAIAPIWNQAAGLLDAKMAEYAAAVIAGKPHFHISLVIDVSPCCDCHAENDLPIVPDVGIFASFDPVALDQACADAVNAQKPVRGSVIDGSSEKDIFTAAGPSTDWRLQLIHAEKIGIGTRKYNLITVK